MYSALFCLPLVHCTGTCRHAQCAVQLEGAAFNSAWIHRSPASLCKSERLWFSWKVQPSTVPGYTGLQRPCVSQSGFGVVRRHAQRVVQLGEPGQVPARRVEALLAASLQQFQHTADGSWKALTTACSRAPHSTARTSRHISQAAQSGHPKLSNSSERESYTKTCAMQGLYVPAGGPR